MICTRFEDPLKGLSSWLSSYQLTDNDSGGLLFKYSPIWQSCGLSAEICLHFFSIPSLDGGILSRINDFSPRCRSTSKFFFSFFC